MSNKKVFDYACKQYNIEDGVSVTDVMNMIEDAEDKNSVSSLVSFLKAIETVQYCPKCNGLLYCSDVEGYNFVCPICDENF